MQRPDITRTGSGLGVPIAVRHQTGKDEMERLIHDYQRRNIQARVDDLLTTWRKHTAKPTIVITTAGALTLAELAMFGLPAFLVPLAAAANDHQIANAEIFAKHGGGAWVSENAWDTELLANQMAATLGDLEALSAQSGVCAKWPNQTRRTRWWKSAKLACQAFDPVYLPHNFRITAHIFR